MTEIDVPKIHPLMTQYASAFTDIVGMSAMYYDLMI
jgi:hypothetical protein